MLGYIAASHCKGQSKTWKGKKQLNAIETSVLATKGLGGKRGAYNKKELNMVFKGKRYYKERELLGRSVVKKEDKAT